MPFTQPSNFGARKAASRARPRTRAKTLRRSWEIDRVTALAILAASAIFAPFALAILNQAAKIFAH
jgi:hypothetical protein